MKLEEIIEKAKENYPVGTYILNAYYKRFPDEQVDSFDEKIGYVEDDIIIQFTGERFLERAGSNAIAVYNKNNPCGLLYCDGEWADICDQDGDIIKVIKTDHQIQLELVRELLYKD